MTKLKREPIITQHSVGRSVLDFPKLEITIENQTYDISDLANLENIYQIVVVLKNYVKTQSAGKFVFGELKNFLEFILVNSGKIDENAMIKYKKFLDSYEDNSLSTKYQKFLRATGFVKLLIREDVRKRPLNPMPIF